jgi:hypothetical protein
MMNPEDFIDWLFGPQGGGSEKRPWRVLEWARALSNDEGPAFWGVIRGSWAMFDLIPHAEFAAQFFRYSDTAPGGSLTEPTRLYRGQDTSAPLGLSWTTNLQSASGFARGHRGFYNPSPVIFSHIARPGEVAFTCEEREEKEHVLFSIPSRHDCQMIRRKPRFPD